MAAANVGADGLDLRTDPQGSAVFSACGHYRYDLTCEFEEPGTLFDGGEATRGTVCWVLANPETADEAVLDPTLTRCAKFSRAWGFSSMVIPNVLAYRATDPKAVVAAARDGVDDVGPAHDAYLARRAGIELVVGCGAFGLVAARASRVLQLLGPEGLCCVGRNRDDSPRHSLYLPASAGLVPFDPEARDGGTVAAARSHARQ